MAQHYTPIWDDWPKVTQELNDQEKGRLIDAIVAYDIGGDWQDRIKGNERYVFPGYQSRIDRYKEANAGKTKDKDTETEKTEKTKKSESDKKNKNSEIPKVYVKDNDKDNDIKENPLTGVKEKRERFSPPTVEEVSAYCKERRNSVDAQRFVDFYASKGWRVGQNPMKDWKAAVRTWEQRDSNSAQAPIKQVRANQYQQREYDEDDLEARLGVNDLFSADYKGVS